MASQVIKNRFLGFLIWQSIPSTAIFVLTKTLFLSSSSLSTALLSFLAFHLSHLLFSSSLSFISFPFAQIPAGPLELAAALLRALIFSAEPVSPELRRRARVSLGFVLFAAASAAAGFVAALSVCWTGSLRDSDDGLAGRLGFRGFVMGSVYGLDYLYKRRWVLEFPIIQVSSLFIHL